MGTVCNIGILGIVFTLNGFDPIKGILNGVYLTGFFNKPHDGPFICYQNQQLAARIAAMPEAALRLAKPGPNDPCPCESGKKYKKCCGR
jgi:hypothetical protein